MSEWKQDAAARRDERATKDDAEARHRSKKNTKKWCKGKVGREHTTAVVAHPTYPCGPKGSWWPCNHQEVCEICGKVLRWFISADECPALSGT